MCIAFFITSIVISTRFSVHGAYIRISENPFSLYWFLIGKIFSIVVTCDLLQLHFQKHSPKPPVGNTFLWQVVLLNKKVPAQLCSNILLTWLIHIVVFPVSCMSCILQNKIMTPFKSIHDLFLTSWMHLSFLFPDEVFRTAISLFPAALATFTGFWHIVSPLPSSQMVLNVLSWVFLTKE